jgi:hypothetical protein
MKRRISTPYTMLALSVHPRTTSESRQYSEAQKMTDDQFPTKYHLWVSRLIGCISLLSFSFLPRIRRHGRLFWTIFATEAFEKSNKPQTLIQGHFTFSPSRWRALILKKALSVSLFKGRLSTSRTQYPREKYRVQTGFLAEP